MTLGQLRDIVDYARLCASMDNAQVLSLHNCGRDEAFYFSKQLSILSDMMRDIDELGTLMDISGEDKGQQVFFISYENVIDFMDTNTYAIYGRLYRENHNRQPSFYGYLGELRKIAAFDLFTTSMIQVSYNFLASYLAFNEECGDNDMFGNLMKK